MILPRQTVFRGKTKSEYYAPVNGSYVNGEGVSLATWLPAEFIDLLASEFTKRMNVRINNHLITIHQDGLFLIVKTWN